MSDAPIGVVASGSGGLTVARMIAARLPHEDVVVLCDHAYAPWGRRPGRAVSMRVAALGDDLAAYAPKAVVLASAQGTLDALDALRARTGSPVVGLDGLMPFAAAAAGGRPVALVTGEGCVRGVQQGRSVRRQRGGVGAVSDVWPGLAELVEAGSAASPAADELAAGRVPPLIAGGVGAILLACPHASAVRAAVERAAAGQAAVVDGAAVAVDRAVRLLRRSNALARRKRAGRVIVVSSDPARGAAGLTA
jgi:glutamate racemase